MSKSDAAGIEPYQRGRDDFGKKVPFANNPYSDLGRASDWDEGWLDAEIDKAANEHLQKDSD